MNWNRTNAKPRKQPHLTFMFLCIAGDDHLPMLNHWQEEEKEEEAAKEGEETVFLGDGEKEFWQNRPIMEGISENYPRLPP